MLTLLLSGADWVRAGVSLTPPPSSSLSPLCWCPLLRLGHVALLGEYLARVAPRRRERRSGCDVRSNSERLAGKKTKQKKRQSYGPFIPGGKGPAAICLCQKVPHRWCAHPSGTHKPAARRLQITRQIELIEYWCSSASRTAGYFRYGFIALTRQRY